MKWEVAKILNDANEEVFAQAPVIVSASRSTDIPTFYSNWFVERWKVGHVSWKNPFNGRDLYVSFKNTRVVVFWTKNPKPIMRHLDFLNENVKNFYFNFSLNDYDNEGLERKVPSLDKRIETFLELSSKIGSDKVIWRFDPIILTDKIGVEDILNKIRRIGEKLKGYTSKLVISFADINNYPRVKSNLEKERVNYIDFKEDLVNSIASGISEINLSLDFEVSTCAENVDLGGFGISHNKCIDDNLLVKLFHQDNELMDFLGVKVGDRDLFGESRHIQTGKNIKDKGQREACGCIMSKDIGQYNTCPHECLYCYANSSKESALRNYKSHLLNPNAESINGA